MTPEEFIAEGKKRGIPYEQLKKRYNELKAEGAFDEPEIAEPDPVVNTPEPPPEPEAQPKSRGESIMDLWGGYFNRLGNAYDNRVGEVADSFKRYADDEQGLGSTVLQTLGKSVGFPLDVAGETISTGVATVSDVVDPEIRKGFQDIVQGVVDSPSAQDAIKYYQSLEPEVQANIESVFNLGTALAPFKFKGTKVLSKATEKKRGLLKNMFEPKRNTENISKELKWGTERVDKMVDDLMEVKGLSPVRTPETNIKILKGHMTSLDGKIKGALTRWHKKNPTVAIKGKETIMRQVDDILNTPEFKTLGLDEKQIGNISEKIGRQLDGIFETLDNKKTLTGLLDARRKFDKLIRDPSFKKSLEGKSGQLSGLEHVNMELRRRINKIVAGAVKDDANVLELLGKQSSMYDALDNFSTKIATELSTTSNASLIEKTLTQHPLATYTAMRNRQAAIPLAAITAAPSLINWGGNLLSEGSRLFGNAGLAGRTGLIYGQPEQEVMPTPEEELLK